MASGHPFKNILLQPGASVPDFGGGGASRLVQFSYAGKAGGLYGGGAGAPAGRLPGEVFGGGRSEGGFRPGG